MDEVSYGKDDRLDGLSVEQWELLANTQGDLLLSYLENRTVFDVHRVRLMLDLAVVEAKRRIVFLRSGDRKFAGMCELRTDEGSGTVDSLPQNATRRDTAESVLKEILETETARQIFLKMKEGQGTETEEGKVWIKARNVWDSIERYQTSSIENTEMADDDEDLILLIEKLNQGHDDGRADILMSSAAFALKKMLSILKKKDKQ